MIDNENCGNRIISNWTTKRICWILTFSEMEVHSTAMGINKKLS